MLILVKMSGMAESVIDRVVKSDSLLSLVELRALVMGLSRGQRAALVISCCLSEKLEPDQGPGWPPAKTDDTQINWHRARKQFEEELFFFLLKNFVQSCAHKSMRFPQLCLFVKVFETQLYFPPFHSGAAGWQD